MLHLLQLTAHLSSDDVYGWQDAVKEGLIDEVGGIDQALHKLHEIIREQKNECL